MVTRFISCIYYIVLPLLTAELFLKTQLLTDCTQYPSYRQSYQGFLLNLGLQSPRSTLASFGPASQRRVDQGTFFPKSGRTRAGRCYKTDSEVCQRPRALWNLYPFSQSLSPRGRVGCR